MTFKLLWGLMAKVAHASRHPTGVVRMVNPQLKVQIMRAVVAISALTDVVQTQWPKPKVPTLQVVLASLFLMVVALTALRWLKGAIWKAVCPTVAANLDAVQMALLQKYVILSQFETSLSDEVTPFLIPVDDWLGWRLSMWSKAIWLLLEWGGCSARTFIWRMWLCSGIQVSFASWKRTLYQLHRQSKTVFFLKRMKYKKMNWLHAFVSHSVVVFWYWIWRLQ